MKRTNLFVIALILVTTYLQAQSIAGNWQGRLVLPNSNNPRLVITVENNTDGSLHGSMTPIDAGGGSMPLTSVNFVAPDVTITQSAAGDTVFVFSGTTMPQLLGFIMNLFQDKQLVDETGLTGPYDITLRIPSSTFDSPSDRGPNDERGRALIDAAEHAGFKFVSKKGTLPIVIVDHIDPPTPN